MNDAQKLSLKHILLDAIVILSLIAPIDIDLAPIAFYLVMLGVIFYSILRTTIKRGGLVYGLSLVGVLFLFMAMTFITLGFLITFISPWVFILFLFWEEGQAKKGHTTIFRKIFSHESRYIIFPLLTAIFLNAGEVYIVESVHYSITFAIVLLNYIPIRLIAYTGEDEKWYEQIIKFASIAFATSSLFALIQAAPQKAVWETMRTSDVGYYDKMRIIEHPKYLSTLVEHLNIQEEVKLVHYQMSSPKAISSDRKRTPLIKLYNYGIVKKVRLDSSIGPAKWVYDKDLTFKYAQINRPSDDIGLLDFKEQIDNFHYYNTVFTKFPVEVPMYTTVLENSDKIKVRAHLLADTLAFEAGNYDFVIKKNTSTAAAFIIDWVHTDSLNQGHLAKQWYLKLKSRL